MCEPTNVSRASGKLEPDRLPVAPRVGAGHVAVLGADDDLPRAEVQVRIRYRCEHVPEAREAVPQLGRGARLEVDRQAFVELPARRVERGLRVLRVSQK